MNGSNKSILLRWEKWRIGYNLILLVESLGLLWGRLAVAFADSLFMGWVIFAAVGANVCYCLGPLIEIYVSTFGGIDPTRHRALWTGLRCSLFWVGLGFSMLVVYSLVIHSLWYLDGYP